ncbi:MAG: dTMP kinase [Pseudomonadota bacterium]
MARGRFITLEGGEGAGKSTLLARLQAALSARDVPHIVTREPGGTPLAEAARALVLTPPGGEEWSPLGQALLMNAARQDHLQRLIRPALMRGDWVLCDRFSDSTRVYQGITGVPAATLDALEHLVVADTLPDLTLILDGDPQLLAQRRAVRGTSDVFEQKDMTFHHGVRDAFLARAKSDPARYVVIDALQAPERLAEIALTEIENRLGWP